jgi:signal transduction histidine kinase
MKARTAHRIAWGTAALFIALALVGETLVVLNRSAADVAENVALGLVFMAMAVVGALVASRRPENPIGWILVFSASGVAVAFVSGEYAYYALVTNPGSLPGAQWASWLSSWVWLATFTPLLTFLLLLFPDGHLPSHRWRPVAWVGGAVVAFSVLVVPFAPDLDSELPVRNPVEVSAIQSVAEAMWIVVWPLLVALIVASAASLIVRFRRASGEEREQIKWFAFGASVMAGSFVLSMVLGLLNLSQFEETVPGTLLSIVGFASIPAAAGIAILKYRLYDIDIVIKKTVVFGVVAAFMTLVYVAIVVGIGTFVASESNAVLTIAAAAVIAVAFQPVRERARHLANRLVYGKRASPYELLSEFSGRVSGVYATEDLLPRTARVIGEGTGATRADVWLKVGSQIRPAGTWPDEAPRLEAMAVPDGEVPPIPGADGVFPVRHQGELLGALTLTKPRGEPLTPAEEKLLTDVASQAGLVLRNVRLTAELRANLEELRASRQRIVTAQDEERRRLERNIHDGAQQQLVALAMKLGLARTLAQRDPNTAFGMLDQLQSEAQDALDNLRDLARGIYPPLLADQGLVAALDAQARKASIHVDIEADGIGRYPQDVEAAVYFCTLEALQNVAKYAAASRVTVTLAADDGEVLFTVSDDGVGFDPATARRGSGLTNMSDRLSALGGTVEIRSAPGEGTTVSGRLPARADP